jgi:hypothetical protein
MVLEALPIPRLALAALRTAPTTLLTERCRLQAMPQQLELPLDLEEDLQVPLVRWGEGEVLQQQQKQRQQGQKVLQAAGAVLAGLCLCQDGVTQHTTWYGTSVMPGWRVVWGWSQL